MTSNYTPVQCNRHSILLVLFDFSLIIIEWSLIIEGELVVT